MSHIDYATIPPLVRAALDDDFGGPL